ncbi:MAG: hypothetical protein R2847_10720 [Bacteroidia bacterium]
MFCQRVNSNTYYLGLLITPNHLGPYSQNIGNSRGVLPGGMTGFSPDGTKFAFFYAMYTSAGGLDVYDFNRCSGALSNPVHVLYSANYRLWRRLGIFRQFKVFIYG